MTGPAHYSAGELCIELAGEASEAGNSEDATGFLMAAQAHFTAALAAATALSREGGGVLPAKDRAAWFDVASEHKKEAAA